MSGANRPRDQRFAILLPSLKFGGAERVALNLARALKALGWDVAILVMSREGEFLAEAEREYEVVDLKSDRTRKLPGRLASYLSVHPTDILLSSFWKLNLCACVARLFVAPQKLLLWEHSPPSISKNSPKLLYAISASLLYRMADRVICVSGGVRDDVARWTVGLKGRLRVIANPIPPPSAPLAAVHAPGGTKRIAWVGRLDDPKNPQLLVEAFALVANRIDAEVVYVGDGPFRMQLEQRCRELGLQQRVMFAGFQPAPYDILSNCDLLALTSDREGLPTVLVEALHCGLGVVSTDCGQGVHEILCGSTYGTIVPKNDPRALAGAIESELNLPRDRATQMHGAERFRPDVIATEFLSAAGDGA